MTCIVVKNGLLAVESATTQSDHNRLKLTNKIQLVPGGLINGDPVRAIVGTGSSYLCRTVRELYRDHVWRITHGELDIVGNDQRLEPFETESLEFKNWFNAYFKHNLGRESATILALGNAKPYRTKGGRHVVKGVRVIMGDDVLSHVAGVNLVEHHFGCGRYTTQKLGSVFTDHHLTAAELVWLSTKLNSGCNGVVQSLDLTDPTSRVCIYAPTKKRKMQLASLLRKHLLDALVSEPAIDPPTTTEV